MKHPLINRTSPKGQAFVGTCAACGKTGLTSAAMQEECENVRGMTQEDALLEAIDPPHAEQGAGEPQAEGERT